MGDVIHQRLQGVAPACRCPLPAVSLSASPALPCSALPCPVLCCPILPACLSTCLSDIARLFLYPFLLHPFAFLPFISLFILLSDILSRFLFHSVSVCCAFCGFVFCSVCLFVLFVVGCCFLSFVAAPQVETPKEFALLENGISRV